MRRMLIILMVSGVCILMAGWNEKPHEIAAPVVKNWVLKELFQLEHYLDEACASRSIMEQRKLYQRARQSYKHVELIVEFYSPGLAKFFINGPPVPKYDAKYPQAITPPRGFQQIEAMLYGTAHPGNQVLKKEWLQLRDKIREMMDYYAGLELEDYKLLEMMQLELFRITALNLCGYDATLTQTNVREAVWSLEGINDVARTFAPYLDKKPDQAARYALLMKHLASTKAFLLSNTSYAGFNRMKFITEYVIELNHLLLDLHGACELPWTQQTALNLHSVYPFSQEGFNKYFFAFSYTDTINQALQAKIGRLLFFDPVLSGKNNRSCASCHNPSKAFTDGLSKSRSVDSSVFLTRNAPTLLNVIFQRAFFYDGRALQLEQQAFDVIHNSKEMEGSLADAVLRLRESTEYKKLFARAFAGTEDSVITPNSVQKAVAKYEKTLISFNSRFDKYMKGQKKALTKREISGFNLFLGKALCGSCHFFPLFNGTVPPYYNDSEFEVIGGPATEENKQLDGDPGRYSIIRLEELKHAFKTPTLRNIGLTAPYMHNGAYRNLDQVVEFYHRGGGAGLGFHVPNQTLPFDSLHLSPGEKKDIVLFLETLTDTTGLTAKPTKLPAFEKNESLNRRRIGGIY